MGESLSRWNSITNLSYWQVKSPAAFERRILQAERMCGVSPSGRDRVRRPSSADRRHTAGRGGGERTSEHYEVQPGVRAGTATSGSSLGHQSSDQSFGGPLGFRV